MKKGWEYKRLGDITEIKGGKRLPKGVKLLTTPTKHPYIRVADFNDFGTVDTDDIHYISDSVYEQIKRYIIKKEDVYISIAGTIGKSGIIPDYLDGANLTENACRLILSNNVYQRYIYYFTISPSFIKQIDEQTKKSAQPKLALTRLSDVIISYPTIKEQQSIVDYLDSAFAKIDAMKANAEKALNEAKALFQASLKEMLEPREGWEEKKVKDVAEIKGGKRLPKGEKLQSEPTSHKYIRVADFNEHGTVDLSDIQYISDKVYEQIKRYIINKEDIYISIAGTIGKSGFVPVELDGANLTENACRLILSKEINQKFMYYTTISPEFIRQEIESTKISAQPKLALTRLADIIFAYPSIIEQQSIATTLDSIKSKVDRLQANYEKISQECDALKQAILRQVFE